MIDNQTAPYAAFLLRVSSGALLLAHGLMKIFHLYHSGYSWFL